MSGTVPVPAAIILDVDGTMYAQRPVQMAMLLRLAGFAARRPVEGARCVSALRAYRHAQETLRSSPDDGEHAGRMQYQLAAARSRTNVDTVRGHVARWMEQEPLGFVARAGHPGLREFLLASRARGIALGVFSDYPAEEKLRALGVRELVDVVRSAHDSDIGCFKPDPRGLLVVAAELGVRPAECVYVGDRAEVDGVAAGRAGMRGFIIDSGKRVSPGPWERFAGFSALTTMLLGAPSHAMTGP